MNLVMTLNVATHWGMVIIDMNINIRTLQYS